MRKRLVFVTLALLAAALLSGCASGAGRGSSWPGLTADNSAAYLADGVYLYAINLKDGTELWQFSDRSQVGGKSPLFIATPVITPDGLIIAGSASNNRTLYAIDPKDINTETKEPTVAWVFTGAEDHWIAAPLIVGNKLFAPNADGNLYVLNLDDGQSSKNPVTVVKLNGRLWAQPATDGTRIFVTSLDHSMYALDLETYKILWHKDLTGAVPGAPVIGSDRMLYVGTFASQLERFDPATGEHESVVDTEGWVWNTPSLEGDTLYFGDLSGKFYSFNAKEKKLNWSPVQPDGPITANPLVMGDSVLVATESGSIYELDQEGRSKEWGKPGGKIYTTPVLSGDLILVAPLGAEHYLYAYGTDSHQAWAFTPGK